MAQRLEVANALYGCSDGFAIDDIARAKFHREAEPVGNLAAQYLQLYLAHQVNADLAQRIVPHNGKLRLFFLQLAQVGKCCLRIGPFGQQHLTGEHGGERGPARVGLCAKPFARPGCGKAGNGAQCARPGLLRHGKARAGINAQLIGLFFPRPAGSGNAAQRCFGAQHAAGNF